MKTTTLVIMDGFGIPKYPERSAINKKNTLFLQGLAKKYPNTSLFASEEFVGLPKKQPGTSDVGHLTIGTGRVKMQPLVEINHAISDGSFFKNKELMFAMEHAKRTGKALHLLGIVSDGGVHSYETHLYALLKLASELKIKRVYIHFIADGRDTPPKSVKKYIARLQKKIDEYGVGEIATLIGRAYALDRDKNWDRNKLAYDMMIHGEGRRYGDILSAVRDAYKLGENDEFFLPMVMTKCGKPITTITDGDSVIFFNYRADRERQLAYVMVEKNDFDWVKNLHLCFVCMTEYDNTYRNVKVAFPPHQMSNILSEVVSKNGIKQAKIAESEKYAYVSFSFNDGKQDTYPGEERFVTPSPKVLSFAQKPEMSAKKVAQDTVTAIMSKKYGLIVVNFANCDMVGHCGEMKPAEIAVKTVDDCVKQVVEASMKCGGNVVITADHGNADEMIYADGSSNKSHTTAKVPFILISDDNRGIKLKKSGTLADVAPTILELMKINKPNEMTGSSLICH